MNVLPIIALTVTLLAPLSGARAQGGNCPGVPKYSAYIVYRLAGGCESGFETGVAAPAYFSIFTWTPAQGLVFGPGFAVTARGQTNGQALRARLFTAANPPPGVGLGAGEPCRCQNPSSITPIITFTLYYPLGWWKKGIKVGLAAGPTMAGPWTAVTLNNPAPWPAGTGPMGPPTCIPCSFGPGPGPGGDTTADVQPMVELVHDVRSWGEVDEWQPQVVGDDLLGEGLPSGIDWLQVHPLFSSPCTDLLVLNGRGDDLEPEDVWCFETPDSAWPVGQGTWTHYPRYEDPANPLPYDSWHLTFDPDYVNKGNTCTFSNKWMWAAKPDAGTFAENDFDMVLVSPMIDVAGWTGGLVVYSEYQNMPPARNDLANQLVRVHDTSYGWSGWFDPDGVPVSGGGDAWDMNRTFDFSHFLGSEVDSCQVAFEIFDASFPGEFAWGNHGQVQYLVDNVSIGSYDGSVTRFRAGRGDLFSDTFSLSDPAHSARMANTEEGDWVGVGGSRSFASEDSLSMVIEDRDGLVVGSVDLWWRHDSGPETPFGPWSSKTMNYSDPVGSPTREGIYRAVIGRDDGGTEDLTASGDGRIWAAGTTVQYYVRVVDDILNIATFPSAAADPAPEYLDFSVLPFLRETGEGLHILVVDDFTRYLLDFENTLDTLDWVYDEPEDMVERALALLYGGSEEDPRWDVYDVAGADGGIQREPRVISSSAQGLGGIADDSGVPIYDAVLWVNGNLRLGSLEDTTRTQLQTYLDNGGNLLVMGDDVAYHLGVGGTNADSSIGFITDYLGAQLATASDDRTESLTLNVQRAGTSLVCGLSGDCLFDMGLMPSEIISPKLRAFDRLVQSAPTGGTSSILYEYESGGVSDNGRAAVTKCVRTAGGGVGVLAGFGPSALISDLCRASFLTGIFTLDFGLPVANPVNGSQGVGVPVSASAGSFSLAEASPSPFGAGTEIRFTVGELRHVSLDVYSVAGRKVRTLVDEPLAPGGHTRRWDGRNDGGRGVASGIYFYKMISGEFQETRKVVLVK